MKSISGPEGEPVILRAAVGRMLSQGATDLYNVNLLLDADENFRKRDQLPSGAPGMATLTDPSLASKPPA